MKKAIQIYCSLVTLLLLPIWASAQCTWSFNATPDSSRCAASGKISILLNGPDASNVTNRLYRLKSASSSYEIPHSTAPLFENLAPGDYYITVRGFCGSVEDSVTKIISVPGNYIAFNSSVQLVRAAFPNCGSGQLRLTFENGRRGYKAVITSKPPQYTGPTTYNTQAGELLLDNLYPGSYTIVQSDSCGSNSAPRTITVPALPAVTADEIYLDYQTPVSCNRIRFKPPNVQWASMHRPYFNLGTNWLFAVSYDGVNKSAFKPVCDTSMFEIDIPSGQTVKDLYGKNVYYHFKDLCGQETVYPVGVNLSWREITFSNNCNLSFNVSPLYAVDMICSPIVITLLNKNTGAVVRDTAYSWSNWHLDSLAFGSYNIRVVTGDSALLFDRDFSREAPPAMPYNMTFFAQNYGHHQFGDLFVTGANGDALRAGTKLELVYPASHYRTTTLPFDNHTVWFMSNENQAFTTGTYVVKITDACNTYFDTVVVKQQDVWVYDWEIMTRDTCAGQILNIEGSAAYQNASHQAYYRIASGPAGWQPDYTIRPMGTSMILPIPGDYSVIVGAYSQQMYHYPEAKYGGNLKTFSWTGRPLTIDPIRTIGWVCPAAADNTGSIIVQLSNPLAATYTYQLAAQGQGGTGPYIATNTTGRFNSGSGYNLMVNQNYDIKVTDACGASVVQTVKIIDFATAQLASLNKPAYCQGDVAKLNVINLPGSAITYNWSGPGGYTSSRQNPVISNLTDAHEGQYIVVIDADICSDPIRDTVNLVMAAFETVCFSAITDTSVNPYTAGILGNWRPHRTYAYYGARKESDPQAPTNIRTDGTYNDFLSFWKKQTTGWKAQQDTTRWVWNSESTIFNKKGFELENRDALNRFNSAIYGFEDAIPVAVVQNSMLREAAFEGFEDFYFKGNDCATGDCATARRFDFTRYMSWLDTTQHHTGRYSIKIPAGDTMQTSHMVVATAPQAGQPIFEKQDNTCVGTQTLKKVKADASMIIPPFSPLANKKVLFSAWVKEDKDCNCATYEGNVVQLVVKQGESTFLHEIRPSGNIIEGWQRYEEAVDLPAGTTQLSVMIIAKGTSAVFVDDIRLHPFNANMKSYAYDPVTLRMMAELDENNFATFFEYDDDGVLTRVKKETERGIKTIKETRSALVKE